MALLHAKPRRLIVSWALLIAITLCVIFLRYAPPVYRSIVDAGVVSGLSWGLVSLIYTSTQAFRGDVPSVMLDLP
jgi:FtsH-binding integral membrane protein